MPLVTRLTRHAGLLRQHDFRNLWLADVISQFGTRISFLALPLAAVSYLHATTFEVSLLGTAQTIAYLLVGLQVGAWCDRMRRGPVVVAADLGRALLFAWIPIGALLGVLTVWQLYIVVGLSGVLTVFFNVARRAYVPRLIAPADLVEGNTKLATNQSVAAIAAPAVAGALVQWLGAPVTIALDAASYLWSGLWLRGIRAPEPTPPEPQRRHLAQEIGEGLRLVFGQPILRAIGLHGAGLALFQALNGAVIIVFLVRVVHLSPGVIGVLSTVGLLGALLATAITRTMSRLLGRARLVWLAGLLCGAGFLLEPVAAPGWRIVFVAASTFVAAIGIIVLNIVETSFEQAVCPPQLLGRLSATMNFLTWGAMPAGSLLGGVAGTLLGPRATLVMGGLGALASVAFVLWSPLRKLRDLPDELPGGGDGDEHVPASSGHA
ncbi:MAG TPA: MFS transporter [Pseudonocardiaceae bacterium]|nr:MFS transporter [Pseudonocardiaceae bacterium]